MMTLEEAIRHAEQVADSYKDTAPDCSCAAEHRQLAAWLKELKRLKENGPDMVSKEKVLQILHECIVGPEIDEDDSAVVDYRMAKNAVVKMDVESNSMLRPGDVVWFHGTCGIVTKAKMQDALTWAMKVLEDAEPKSDEESELKFYYVESIDDYWVGRRLDNFYYANWHEGLGFVWSHSRYLPWGEHIVDENTLWKEHTYPSEPKEIQFTDWIMGFLKKYSIRQTGEEET